ncbi:MAG TPA: zinc-dependent metalloprotease [Burkholderiaceae bacterium]|nr:zinc-dependent metalloprotease [Burkholderiaceae bacterium]
MIALVLGACAATPTSDKPPAAASAATAVAAQASTQTQSAPAPGTANRAGPPATQGGASPPAAPGGAAPPAARPGEPPTPRPFADVVRDAKETKGFFGVWQKDEKVWLEIKPEQLDKPLFFGIGIAGGLGEITYLPGLMGQEQVVELRKVGTTLQLVARNLNVRAPAGSPLEAAVRESYSDSLLASAPIASAPHPERKSILVDAAALFGGDIPGAQTTLETAYRVAYTLDRPNTSVEQTRTVDAGTFVTVRAHYAVPKLPAPPAGPVPPGTVLPSPIQTVPDPRSLFLTFIYTLTPLPSVPMHPRVADQRVGHFTTDFVDYMSQGYEDRRTHYISRWRLEKKDPQAEISEPKEPILVWMDKNIPEQYRPAVQAGILEWNKAFERAGFKNALVVQQQPADADWSTFDGTRHLAVRWFSMTGPGAVAVGPHEVDLRTGEILRAAAIIPENWVRLGRLAFAEVFPAPPASSTLSSEAVHGDVCTYAQDALEHAAFGLELLEARGAIDPNGPDGDRFTADNLKQVVMHEIGHALGLRHNFRGSTGITLAELRDPAFVRTHGISNSIMDYVPFNLPLENERPSVYTQVTLGAYDYWAIEYAYREFAPEVESAELAGLAARSETDPNLAFATDEDVSPQFGGIDPLVNRFDLGEDPLAYYKRSFKLVRELWARTEKRELKADDNLAVYRRNLVRGLNQMAALGPLIAKYIGGVYTSRGLAGVHGPILTPVPTTKQREALEVLSSEIFSSDSFRFNPAFMSRLGVDYLDRFRPNQPTGSPDFSLPTAVLTLQRAVLDLLMSDAVAMRLADAETKVSNPRQLLTFADLQTRLTAAIWSEVKTGRDIDSLRRNLQREHVRRLASSIVRPTSPVATDVRAVQRQVAVDLVAELKRALANPRLSGIARAHLAESAALLDEALKAPMTKQGA